MRFSILILMLFAPSIARAVDWTVYVDPSVRTAKITVRQPNQNPLPAFFVRADFEEAVTLASESVGRHANWRLRVVRNRSEAQIEVISENTLTYSKMYAGNNVHAAGLWEQNRNPRRVVVHDGWTPKHQSGSGHAGWWWYTRGNINSLAGLILHEIGHSNTLVGPTHRLDLGKLMQKNPPSGEIALVQDVFGKAVAKPEDPKPPTDAPGESEDPKPPVVDDGEEPTGTFENRRWGKWKEEGGWNDVVSGDFNGDGTADVTGRRDSGDIWVMLTIDGKFKAEKWGKWSSDADWKNVVSGDFDGDGRDDLAGSSHGNWWIALSRKPEPTKQRSTAQAVEDIDHMHVPSP